MPDEFVLSSDTTAARSAKWTSGLVCEVIARAAKNTS